VIDVLDRRIDINLPHLTCQREAASLRCQREALRTTLLAMFLLANVPIEGAANEQGLARLR
jgi:hypothetical protein